MKKNAISNFVIFVMVCLSLLLFTKAAYELVVPDDNKNSDILFITKKGFFRNQVSLLGHDASNSFRNCVGGNFKNKKAMVTGKKDSENLFNARIKKQW